MSHNHNQCSSDHNHCCCCNKGTCCHHEHEDVCEHHEHEDFSTQLLEMADEAWMEVLKEKMKKFIEKSSGSQLDQLAQLVAETNEKRWKSKMCKEEISHKFHTDVQQFFHSNKEKRK